MTSSAEKTELAPQLAALVRELEECSDRARALAAHRSAEELARRPAPESWSIAECIAHLTLSNAPFPKLLREAFAEARRDGKLGSGPFKADLLGRLLAWTLEPPPRIKIKARAPFQPVAIDPVESVLPDFLRVQDQIVECIREANGVAVDRVKVASPVDSRVKYNVYAALRVVAAHERRHLWQAEKIRK